MHPSAGADMRSLRQTRAIGAALALTAACGCGALSPTAPTTMSSASVAVVDGVITGRPGLSALDRGPEPDILIEALDGERVLATTVTDQNGNYHLAIKPAQIRLRASKPGYPTAITDPFSVTAGDRMIHNLILDSLYVQPLHPLVPRVVRGMVTNSTGGGVPSAVVSVFDRAGRIGAGASTDENGAFTVSFRAPAEPVAVTLSADHSGYPHQLTPLTCCADPAPIVVNITMPVRVAAVTILGPSTLAVSQAAQYMTKVTFEDGSEIVANPILFRVLGGVENSAHGSGMVEGVRAGSGWIGWDYQNVSGTLVIRVTP